MRTPFQQRCDEVYRAHPEVHLRLSTRILQSVSDIAGTNVTYLYVVLDALADAVKIGHARSPKHRTSSLASGNPNPVELILAVPARVGLERVLHRVLESSRMRGEWFHLTPEVLVACELLMSADDFARDAEDEREPEEGPDYELTTEVLCSYAHEFLEAVVS